MEECTGLGAEGQAAGSQYCGKLDCGKNFGEKMPESADLSL